MKHMVLFLALALAASTVQAASSEAVHASKKVEAVAYAAGPEVAAYAAVGQAKAAGNSKKNESSNQSPPGLPVEDATITSPSSRPQDAPAPPPLPEEDEDAPVPPALPQEDDETGNMVSAVQKARRHQWAYTRAELKAVGYTGSVSQFTAAFNNYTKEMKAGVKVMVLNGSHTQLTQKVVLAVANREMAKIREAEMAQLALHDESLDEKIEALTVQYGTAEAADAAMALKGSSRGASVIRVRLTAMEPSFKLKLAYIAVNGSEMEKERLRTQLAGLESDEEKAMASRLTANIKAKKLNHTLIRALMRKQAQLMDILSSQM